MPGWAFPSQAMLLSSTPESPNLLDSGVDEEGMFRKLASKEAGKGEFSRPVCSWSIVSKGALGSPRPGGQREVLNRFFFI